MRSSVCFVFIITYYFKVSSDLKVVTDPLIFEYPSTPWLLYRSLEVGGGREEKYDLAKCWLDKDQNRNRNFDKKFRFPKKCQLLEKDFWRKEYFLQKKLDQFNSLTIISVF